VLKHSLETTDNPFQINIDSQNNVYVSWRTESQNDEVFVKKSTDGGKTFSKEVNISNSPQDSYNYDITIESKGKLYAIWYEEGAAPAGEILLKKSTDGGNTFGNPIQIAQLVKLSDSHVPKIGISSNVLYVVWNDGTLNNPNSNVLFIKRSTDGGKTFVRQFKLIKIIPLSPGSLKSDIISKYFLSYYHNIRLLL
jgi:hypothetical protein